MVFVATNTFIKNADASWTTAAPAKHSLSLNLFCVLVSIRHETKALPQCTCFTGVSLHFKAALPEATGGSRLEPVAE